MATAYHNNGRDQDALKYVREALNHIDHMTERERFHTRGFLYNLTNDYQKCIDEYGALLEKYPSDTSAATNVSFCYGSLRNLPKAVQSLKRAVSILPKRAIYHSNLGFYLSRSGDFQGAAKEAAETLKLNFEVGGLLGQAFASLGQEQPERAAEAYQKLAKSSPSRAATGLADLAVYEGRYQEAVKILDNGVKDDMGARKPAADAAARKLSALAYVQLLRGQKGPALDAAKRALELTPNGIETRFLAGRIYAALGETAKASELATGLSKENQVEPQSYGKLIEGEIALKGGDGRRALNLFTDAKDLLDTWIARFEMGRADLEVKEFAEADSEFDRCIKRRGEALTLFFDPVPTYGYFPEVYYYQGRAREGMGTAGFAESYKKYVSVRSQAGEDPLLTEIRQRIK
jgi:Flp pilus assembly protein TadD